MRSLPILAAVLLSSCAAYVPEYNAAKVAKKTDREVLEYWKVRHSLCRNMNNRHLEMHRDNARKEALKRGLVRPSAVDEIEGGYVAIGMIPNEAAAAWGFPDNINSTVTATGKRDQWVYGGARNGTWTKMRFIYFERDRVTAIQN